MSIMSTMGIAKQALNVSEAAINVISNNISNMNTDGYSRERVVLTPDINYTPLSSNLMGQAYSGSGVTLSNVERYTDAYLLSYYRQQNSQMSYYSEYKTVGSSIEQMTNELSDSSGLEQAFTKFYEAANSLSSNPTSITARNSFVQTASNVASQFNQVYSNLDDLKTSLVGKVNADGSTEGIESSNLANSVKEVNSLLEQIASVNKDIVRTSSNGTAPNSLLDKRDSIITQLSAYLPVTVTENTNATDNISINGVTVIQGIEQKGQLSTEVGDQDTPTVIKLVDVEDKTKVLSKSLNEYIDSGSMGAILAVTNPKSTDLTLNNVLSNLNTMAKGFADEVNRIQTQTETSGGVTTTPLAIDKTTNKLVKATENIFVEKGTTDTTGTQNLTAENITINSKIVNDPYLLAAARTDTTSATYKDTETGNNTNSTEFLNSRSTKLATLDNSDPEDYLSSFVGDIGIKADTINTKYTNQKTVLTQVKNQLSSVTGVDLNEEIVDLTKFQRAYEASARVFSVCNSLLATLVHLGE